MVESIVVPDTEEGGSPHAVDLRRRARRTLAERIVARSEGLPAQDRTLVRLVYHEGRSVSELAGLMGVSARTLRRRVRRLTTRVLSPRFLFVLSHQGKWSVTRRRVAEACVLGGMSLREAARALDLSFHTVRRHHDAVNALFEAACS